MEMVASQRADVTMLEAGDIYRAGKGWGLIPIMLEVQKLLLCFQKEHEDIPDHLKQRK